MNPVTGSSSPRANDATIMNLVTRSAMITAKASSSHFHHRASRVDAGVVVIGLGEYARLTRAEQVGDTAAA